MKSPLAMSAATSCVDRHRDGLALRKRLGAGLDRLPVLEERLMGFCVAKSRFVRIGRAQADFDVASADCHRRAPATNGQDNVSLNLIDDVG